MMRELSVEDQLRISGGAPSAGKIALVLELANDAYEAVKGFCQGVVDGWNAESKS